MITDAELVGLMAKLYAPGPTDFDHIGNPGGDDGVCWGLKHYPDCDALIFRGSMTKEDWFRDVISELGAPPQKGLTNLGFLPLGFDDGVGDAVKAATQVAVGRNPWIIGGHSLGAARAAIAAGISRPAVTRLVLCGCPRPGTTALRAYLAGLNIHSYRNLSDPVCDVPTCPPWCDVGEFIRLQQAPAAGDISIFRDHHIELYLAGVAAYEQGAQK